MEDRQWRWWRNEAENIRLRVAPSQYGLVELDLKGESFELVEERAVFFSQYCTGAFSSFHVEEKKIPIYLKISVLSLYG